MMKSKIFLSIRWSLHLTHFLRVAQVKVWAIPKQKEYAKSNLSLFKVLDDTYTGVLKYEMNKIG